MFIARRHCGRCMVRTWAPCCAPATRSAPAWPCRVPSVPDALARGDTLRRRAACTWTSRDVTAGSPPSAPPEPSRRRRACDEAVRLADCPPPGSGLWPSGSRAGRNTRRGPRASRPRCRDPHDRKRRQPRRSCRRITRLYRLAGLPLRGQPLSDDPRGGDAAARDSGGLCVTCGSDSADLAADRGRRRSGALDSRASTRWVRVQAWSFLFHNW